MLRGFEVGGTFGVGAKGPIKEEDTEVPALGTLGEVLRRGAVMSRDRCKCKAEP